MAFIRRFFLIFFAFFQLQVFAQQPRVVFVNSAEKELKRTAHRMRIPVDQLKNAREALQEATDLATKIEPAPISQLSSIASSWTNINRSKAKGIIDSIIHDLRALAAQPADFSAYQNATSAAMSLLQTQSSSESDYEKMLDMISSWPDPPASFGDRAATYRKELETQIKSNSIMNMASSNPEKAYELLSQSQDNKATSFTSYYLPVQIAQNLMSKGKKDEAMKVIDQTIANFSQQANNPSALESYGSFVSMIASNNLPGTDSIIEKWVTQLMAQPQQSTCAAKIQSGQTTLLDITCAESKILNVLRNLNSRPALVMKTLNSVPGLKAKLDRIGGIDSLSYSAMSGSQPNILTYDTRSNIQPSRVITTVSSSGVSTNNPNKLLQELKGKADTSPSLVKQKLRSAIKGPEDINMLVNLAQGAYNLDPELSSIALDMAQELLPQVEPVQQRASTLQNMVRAYRQVEGEVDPELLKTGFLLADQLREEQSNKTQSLTGTNMPVNVNATRQYLTTGSAEQLETFLVAELSRDSFDTAMRYVRTMENDLFKLHSMIQIVQALSQQY